MHDKFSPVPNGVTYFDGFNDSSINADFWQQTAVGAITIAEASGILSINHEIAGAIGSAFIQSIRKFGWQTAISAGITLVTGSAGADGDHAEASIMLYKDATHYIRFGPYRDTSEAKNNLACIRYNMGAGALVEYKGAVTDATLHKYAIIILGDHVVFILDENIVYDMETALFVDYYLRLESAAPAAGDHIHANFTNFMCTKSPSLLADLIAPSTIGSIAANVITIDGKVDVIDTNVDTINGKIDIIDTLLDTIDTKHTFSGDVTLTNTTATELTFDAVTHGAEFELVLAAALLRGTVPKAVMNDGGAYTDYTTECNNLTTRDVKLLPSVPANGDAFIVSSHEKFCYIDVYMEGGVVNTNNVIALKYWDGDTWEAIPGVVDGTFDTQSLGKSGRISFSPPVDWAEVAIDGYTGYPVEFVVTTFGADVPYATHIQVGLDSSSGFDQVAQEFTDLTVYIKRSFPTIGYQTNPGDSLTYVQSIGHRDVDINGIRCCGDTKVGFQLSATPDKNVVIPYFGFTRRL
jgi:hypothetical protein